MSHQVSPFLDPGPQTSDGSLAIVQLSKDNLQPIYLKEATTATDGYAEGFVLNTRFGSFPHSTLLNVPWGAQVRASAVDTGSRGRKRKRDPNEEPKDGDDDLPNGGKVKEAVAASSGFVHILPPTPELWTMSLPHRTQVVYTPDYSYILHRIRARPGTRLIEAGAGSGSFSHASARAVFNGAPTGKHGKKGKVYSYEFNESRYHKMKQEIIDHRLSDVIQLTHRDVYNDGFLVNGESPEADAVFLDLPSPWEAIPHLARRKPHDVMEQNGESGQQWVSPLNPNKTAYICTFSPCIEQVTQTIEALRKHGWVEIDMVEVNHKRINVSRERLGVTAPQEKGTSQSPRDVMDAIARLKEVEARAREFQNGRKQGNNNHQPMDTDDDDDGGDEGDDDVEDDDVEKSNAKLWLQGRLIHRTESEIKTHTSYLTFAVLPREWSAEQEAAAMARWPCGSENKVIGSLGREERKEEKRKLLLGRKGLKAAAKLAAKQAQNDAPIKKEAAESI